MDRRRRRRASDSSEEKDGDEGNYLRYSSGSSDGEEPGLPPPRSYAEAEDDDEDDDADAEGEVAPQQQQQQQQEQQQGKDRLHGLKSLEADLVSEIDPEDTIKLLATPPKNPKDQSAPRNPGQRNKKNSAKQPKEANQAPAAAAPQKARQGDRRSQAPKGRDKAQEEKGGKPRGPNVEGRVIASFPMPPNWNRPPARELEYIEPSGAYRPAKAPKQPYQPSGIKKRGDSSDLQPQEGRAEQQQNQRNERAPAPRPNSGSWQQQQQQQQQGDEGQRSGQRSKRYSSQRAGNPGDEQSPAPAPVPKPTPQMFVPPQVFSNFAQNQPLFVPFGGYDVSGGFPGYNYYNQQPAWAQTQTQTQTPLVQVQTGKKPIRITTPDHREIDLNDLASH